MISSKAGLWDYSYKQFMIFTLIILCTVQWILCAISAKAQYITNQGWGSTKIKIWIYLLTKTIEQTSLFREKVALYIHILIDKITKLNQLVEDSLFTIHLLMIGKEFPNPLFSLSNPHIRQDISWTQRFFSLGPTRGALWGYKKVLLSICLVFF